MYDDLSQRLAALADEDHARRIQKHTAPLRGVRGVPFGPLAELITSVASTSPPELPADVPVLTTLFGSAWEDGLAAIGLLATCVAADPHTALATGLDWAERTDDVTTADSLGWLVLGPAAGMADAIGQVLHEIGGHARPETRRAAMSMGMAFLPEELEGPAAAGLRARAGERHVRMVEAPVNPVLSRLCSRFARDTAPEVQKAARRVIRAWVKADPDAVVAWAPTVKGGIPKLLGAEVDRAKRRK